MILFFVVDAPQSYGMSLSITKGSHNVACHPILVNVLRLNPSQKNWYLINLPQWDGRLS